MHYWLQIGTGVPDSFDTQEKEATLREVEDALHRISSRSLGIWNRLPRMCRRVTCSKCKKQSWAGCGRHVDSVRSSQIYGCMSSQVFHDAAVACQHVRATVCCSRTRVYCRDVDCMLADSGQTALTSNCIQALAGIEMDDRCACKARTQEEQKARYAVTFRNCCFFWTLFIACLSLTTAIRQLAVLHFYCSI